MIVASATLEADKLKDFFDARTVRTGEEQSYNEPAIITVPGRMFPVQVISHVSQTRSTYVAQVYYSEEPVSDYIVTAVQTAISIDEDESPGDILIFLTSQEECEKATKMINEAVSSLKSHRKFKLTAMPLYSGETALSFGMPMQ